MSGADRKAFRAAVRAAIAADSHFADFSQISAWVQSVDAGALPAVGLATPAERQERTNHGFDQNTLTLAVVVKRVGDGDLEDLLDDDADAMAPLVIGAVQSAAIDCELTQTDIRLDGEGARRIGSLTMAFTVTYWGDAPA